MAEPPPGALLPPVEPPSPHLGPHAVPWRHALAWLDEGMRLFKRRPGIWMLLALLTLATELGFQAAPGPWSLLGKVFAPLVACGLFFAAAAADRRTVPTLRDAVRAFAQPAGTVVAILLASFVTVAGEAITGWWLADVNLLRGDGEASDLSAATLLGVYAMGLLVSLPVNFVPLVALFDHVSVPRTFAASWRAFALNTPPLIVYAALMLALVGVGVATMGLGLLLVLPLWAASSYAAWKDIFGIKEAPET